MAAWDLSSAKAGRTGLCPYFSKGGVNSCRAMYAIRFPSECEESLYCRGRFQNCPVYRRQSARRMLDGH